MHHIFNKKRQYKILKQLGKELPHDLLRKELFDPDDPSNIDTSYLMNEMGIVFATKIIQELRDKRKATHNHLSSLDGTCSWNMCSDAQKRAGLVISATNNVAESSFGGLTEMLTSHSTIGLTAAGAMSMTRQNRDFTTTPILARNKGNCALFKLILHSITNFFITETRNTEHEIGIIHQLSNEMHNSLLTMARRLRPIKAKQDYTRLKLQREEKRRKEEILLKLSEEKACEAHVERFFFV